MTNLQAAERIIALMSSYEKQTLVGLGEYRTATAMAVGALLRKDNNCIDTELIETMVRDYGTKI